MNTCSEVMTTNPTCCTPTDTVEQVAQIMRSEDVGSLPVIDNHSTRKLVGIITDRDMVMKVLAEGRNGQETTVTSVMTNDPVTCKDTDNLDKALKSMADYQVRRIPIVNKNNELVGIIAQADIATRTEQPTKTAQVVEEISKA